MATLSEIASFSDNGEYLAFSSHDGRLKLIETCSNILKQEYTPSSHLSSTCTCLAWCPLKQSFTSPKKKRKKLNNSFSTDPNLLALGTSSGNVLIYSFLQGEVHSRLDNGHHDKVNDVCWEEKSGSLFSCSNDHHIIQWDVTLSKVKHKWKADQHPVYSLCIIDENNLLSASGSIKWWDLSTRQVLKKFIGHATEVFRLLPVKVQDQADAIGTYFLSTAKNDRLVNAWQIQESSNTNSLASFLSTEEIIQIDVTKNGSRDKPVILTALTQSGSLHVFQHQLNGLCKKPLEPKITINITTEGSAEGQAQKLPILASHILLNLEEPRVLISYGSFIRPAFEEITLSTCKSEEWLIRADPLAGLKGSVQQSLTKVKNTERSNCAKVLAPGHMAPSGPQLDSSRKRRDSSTTTNQLPMEERLNALRLEEPKGASLQVPTADNLVHLLLQGLQSSSYQLLDSVLQRNEETTILNTVKRLPLSSIIPLVEELRKRLSGRASGCPAYLRWLKSVLLVHTSYLTTCPDGDRIFGAISQLLEGRSEAFAKMTMLRGKLYLMLSQISSKVENSAFTDDALLVYNSESSSDEDDGLDEIIRSHSESEENWSDMDLEEEKLLNNHHSSSSEEED